MSPFFLPALKARLLADLADLRLDWRGEASSPAPAASVDGFPVQVFIGDLPPKNAAPATRKSPANPSPAWC